MERTRLIPAIVNAANTHLWMGGGVAGAIKRGGGEEIEREAIRQATRSSLRVAEELGVPRVCARSC